MRIFLIACVVGLATVLAAGCQRELPADGSRQPGTATHTWELPEFRAAATEMQTTAAAEAPATSNQVETPTLRGPRLSGQDTLDPGRLSGLWLQVVTVDREIMNLVPTEIVHLLEIQPNNRAAVYRATDQEPIRLEGSWSKPAPGQFILSITGQAELSFFGEMFGDNFLYLWSYDIQVGNWYARLPEGGATQIAANTFDTTRGVLEFKDVVGLSYSGVLHADNEVDVRGLFSNGVLSMRWEDQKGNLGGFAAFIVDPQWNNLQGVWWIDDYEAAPFGGTWNGTRKSAETATDTP